MKPLKLTLAYKDCTFIDITTLEEIGKVND